ncbi:hypothetical protein JL720_13345 [Aureococcus anophagefferens]|nr:hypothetical protein JL720_13345 [Aureococcus anophagefferens]
MVDTCSSFAAGANGSAGSWMPTCETVEQDDGSTSCSELEDLDDDDPYEVPGGVQKMLDPALKRWHTGLCIDHPFYSYWFYHSHSAGGRRVACFMAEPVIGDMSATYYFILAVMFVVLLPVVKIFEFMAEGYLMAPVPPAIAELCCCVAEHVEDHWTRAPAQAYMKHTNTKRELLKAQSRMFPGDVEAGDGDVEAGAGAPPAAENAGGAARRRRRRAKKRRGAPPAADGAAERPRPPRRRRAAARTRTTTVVVDFNDVEDDDVGAAFAEPPDDGGAAAIPSAVLAKRILRALDWHDAMAEDAEAYAQRLDAAEEDGGAADAESSPRR